MVRFQRVGMLLILTIYLRLFTFHIFSFPDSIDDDVDVVSTWIGFSFHFHIPSPPFHFPFSLGTFFGLSTYFSCAYCISPCHMGCILAFGWG